MKVHDTIEVRCLDTDKSWDLFKKNVGEDTLRGHPDIPELARKVAGECRGLPLALNVIGKTMSSKTVVEEWRGALDVLTSSAAEFSGMEDEILPKLKYSYDALNSEQMKSCFLYCSLFPEDSLIDKDRLIEYWKGEGFIDEKVGRTKAYNQGYVIIGTLVRACLLLEEGDDKLVVKMHDVVREMALWITTDLGKNKEKCIVHSGVGLREIPKVENWKNVRRMSLMENEIGMISESHECPELTTLLLQANSLKSISGEFFQFMPRLLVLDLSNNFCLRTLPEQISRLVSLRHLDMSGTDIELLPVGLHELKMLIYLNLNNTTKLESLLGISNLSSLRTLILLRSNVWLDKSLVKELEQLEHLEIVNACISSSMVGEQLLHNSRVGRLMQCMQILERPGETVSVVALPAMDNLNGVFIRDCQMEEIKIKKIAWNKSPTSPCFSNLSAVMIVYCDGLKDLTWLLFAPNLSRLYVQLSNEIEEIISQEKAASILEKERCTIVPFQRLVELYLLELPELKSIYWNALPFRCLKKLVLESCPKLGKLPLDSKSVSQVEDLVIEYDDEEWMERLEWEDEATRHRFLPQFHLDTHHTFMSF